MTATPPLTHPPPVLSSPQTTGSQLRELFAKFGAVSSVRLVKDPATRVSRGFAFVVMTTPDEVDAALKGVSGTMLDGNAVRVARAMHKKPHDKTPGRCKRMHSLTHPERERDQTVLTMWLTLAPWLEPTRHGPQGGLLQVPRGQWRQLP